MPQCRGAAAQPLNAESEARIRERQHAGHLRGRPHAAKPPNGDEARRSIRQIGGSEPVLRGTFSVQLTCKNKQATSKVMLLIGQPTPLRFWAYSLPRLSNVYRSKAG